jgi:hypothetical protein
LTTTESNQSAAQEAIVAGAEDETGRLSARAYYRSIHVAQGEGARTFTVTGVYTFDMIRRADRVQLAQVVPQVLATEGDSTDHKGSQSEGCSAQWV